VGGVMVLLCTFGDYTPGKNKIKNKRWYLRLITFGIILPFIANTSGWLLTEMGRQPWVVLGLMETSDAISPSVTANEMLFSFIAFTSIYAILGAITIYLFVKHIKKENHDD